MGCDFFWSGSIPLNEYQEQAVWFLLSLFGKEPPPDLVMFEPEPDLHLTTLIDSSANQERLHSLYPYNFYGIAPHYKSKSFRDRMQFVFDRSDHGRIVSIGMTRESQDDDEEYERQLRSQGVQVSLRDGGHTRITDGDTALSLLLNVIRMRYCRNLWIGDEYGYCKDVAGEIEAWGLTAALCKNSLDFKACWDLYVGEYDKRHPDPEPETDYIELAVVQEKPKIHPVTPEEAALLIEDIEMSVRSKNCLLRAEITTVGRLLKHSPRDLLNLKGISQRSLGEVQDLLLCMGLQLREDGEE